MPLLVACGALAVGLAGAGLWLGLAYGTAPVPSMISETAVGCCFVVAGLAAWKWRPRSRTGPWMVALGTVILVSNLISLRLPPDLTGAEAIVVIGGVAFWFQFPVAGHLILAFPTGRLPGRAEQILVAAGFVIAVAGAALVLATRTHVPGVCDGRCTTPFQIVADPALYSSVRSGLAIVWIGLAVLALVLLVRRMTRSTPRQRRVLGFALGAACFSVVMVAALFAIQAKLYSDSPGSVAGTIRAGLWVNAVMGWAGVVALPAGFLTGLLRERLAFASVGDLVGRLRHSSPDTVEAGLATTLRDPGLRVAFPSENGLVDVSGAPYRPDAAGRALTPVGDPPIAVLDHDPALLDDPDLLDAAVTAAWLALDNARLTAQVRAARFQIVAAGDEARRRLERDLHDGAQQRLLAIGLALQLLRREIGPDGPGTTLLTETERDLAGALRELRELAAGIHPAVLTDHGLRAALALLALRCPVPLTVIGDDAGRLPAPVEVTAYFCASEAVANAVKHAGATGISVTVSREPGRLLLTVADDGIGGASPAAGTGLRALADRVAALDGTLTVDSPPGRGTQVGVELPCG